MAQKQYTTYQADILSFELRDALLGILQPGRYIGYDQMTEYQAQSGNSVYCRVSAISGINKYDKASPPVLEAARSVAVTTQGTIIAEDSNVDFTIVINGALATGRWHLLYMEHEYTSVQGANPATYGIITGTDGGGKPSLTSATRRIILGYIWEGPTPSDFSDLTYEPKQTEGNFGDHKLAIKLWGSGAGDVLDTTSTGEVGTIPSDGILGNRSYSQQNYINSGESITDTLDALDIKALDLTDGLTTVSNRPIDSSSWGLLTDNTYHNVTTGHHGLMPKLSGEYTEFLNGSGDWIIPPFGMIYPNIASTSYHFSDTGQGGVIPLGTTYDLDMSGVIPSGYTTAFLMVRMTCYWGSNNPSGRYGGVVFSTGTTFNYGMPVNGPPPFSSTALNGNPLYIYWTNFALVRITSFQIVRLSWINYSGSITDWLYRLDLKVVAYR